jgi:hypothetical protein
VLPDDPAVPWCLTFVRLTDRARTTALEHKVLLWRGAALSRSFREGELQVDTANESLRMDRLFKAPRPLATTRGDWRRSRPSVPGLASRAIASGARSGPTVARTRRVPISSLRSTMKLPAFEKSGDSGKSYLKKP